MTFNLISLGLTENSLTAEALKAIKKSDLVFLENYTVDFPYSFEELQKNIPKKISQLPRKNTESEEILKDAKTKNISLLVYGDALSATTHTQLILSCKNQKIPFKVFHNSSILTAIAESGLSLYKFGKTASMPNWKEHTNKPTSFINYIKQNQKIKAHSLLLIDISLDLKNAKQQLKQSAKKENLKLEKIIIISNAGTSNQKIYYSTLKNLPEEIEKPYCFIFPSELNLSEEEFLGSISPTKSK